MNERTWALEKRSLEKMAQNKSKPVRKDGDPSQSGILPVLPDIDDKPPGSESLRIDRPVLKPPAPRKKSPFFVRLLKKILGFFRKLFSRKSAVEPKPKREEDDRYPEQKIGVPRAPNQKENLTQQRNQIIDRPLSN